MNWDLGDIIASSHFPERSIGVPGVFTIPWGLYFSNPITLGSRFCCFAILLSPCMSHLFLLLILWSEKKLIERAAAPFLHTGIHLWDFLPAAFSHFGFNTIDDTSLASHIRPKCRQASADRIQRPSDFDTLCPLQIRPLPLFSRCTRSIYLPGRSGHVFRLLAPCDFAIATEGLNWAWVDAFWQTLCFCWI
ncbi:hypothetical protein BKA66DRAFT_223330 [Pyrenochaeta sp. MPI-SDFR-AT-0127]|nr:hypothetical protein BKA66DRAFT_223330 [Pyrenochaeta sp. MPI-SDFR-AT-0127]